MTESTPGMDAEASRLVETIPELDGVTGMKAVASGGFSRIYKAFQPALNRTVAIKIVDSGGIDPKTRERFDREMGMTGMLGEHPHIVDVYHHGVTRTGEPFLMMRWYEGGSLADGLRESGPMPTAVLLPFAVKVTSALAYVHRHQMLHRDIKPGNILLTALNEPVLADFGIAVDAQQAGTATVAWTPVHAAPEVMAYEEPTPRSDVWSLGSTLYAALAGRPPFPVDPGNTLASIQQRFHAAPPPLVRTDVPSSLTELLTRMLATSAADRPDTVAIITRLQQIERDCGLPVTNAPGVITAPMPPARPGQGAPFPGADPRELSSPSGGSARSGGPADAGRSARAGQAARPGPLEWLNEPSGPGRAGGSAPANDAGGAMLFPPELSPGADSMAPYDEPTLVPERRVTPIRSEVTGTPDAVTVLGRDAAGRREKGARRSWRRRLITATVGGFSTLVVVLVVMAFLAPRDDETTATPETTASFVAPVVSGLRRIESSPTTITVAWHTQGPYQYKHRVVIEGGQTVWLEDDEVSAGKAVLTGLEPATRYCMTVDVIYAAPQTPGVDQEYAVSSSERKCFRTST